MTLGAFTTPLIDEFAKIQAASQNMSAMIAETVQVTKTIAEQFRASLPDPAILQRALRESEQGQAHLDAYGYGFATFDMAVGRLRLIAKEKPDSREIHRAFLDRSRDPVFGERLETRIAGSRVLAQRLPIIRAILTAHLGRSYALSVPCLYAQLEGILTDLLILEGLARRAGSQALSASSGKKLDGLTKKAREYGRKSTPMRTFVTSSILERLSPDRNSVLHGAKTAYRQAKRSARLLLLVDALTHVVEETEPRT